VTILFACPLKSGLHLGPIPEPRAEADVLDELNTWWQDTTPETRTALQDVGLAMAALLGGHVLGTVVARALGARNFDAALGLPGSSPPASEAGHGFTPTFFAGLLVRLTAWAGAAWWLAHEHGQAGLAATLGLVIRRTWSLAAVLVAALALGGLLARRLIDCLQVPPKAVASRDGAAATHRGAAGAVAAAAYALAVLLVLLIAADTFDWPLTRSSAVAIWQLAQNLLTTGAALAIGCVGARWAHELVAPGGAAPSPEKRAGQYTALGIVAVTTVLAVTVLLSTAGALVGLAALALLALLLWLVRGHLPDVAAGLQLRAHGVREVWFDGEPWEVVEVGLLAAQVGHRGAFSQVPNRLVLEARLHGAPAEAPSR
jgi:hypothetical protein